MFSYLKKLLLCITLAIGYIFFLNLQNIWVQEKIDAFIANIKQQRNDINVSISNIQSSWMFQIRCAIIKIQAYNICFNIDNLTLTCYPNIWPLTRMNNSITADRCEIYMPQAHTDPIMTHVTYQLLNKWMSTVLNITPTTPPIHFIGCNHLIIYHNGHELYKCAVYGNISSLYHGNLSIVPVLKDNIHMPHNISCEYNIDMSDNFCCNILYNMYGDSILWNIIQTLAPKSIVYKLNNTPIQKFIQQFTPGELLFRQNGDTFEISCKMFPISTCNQNGLNGSLLFSNWNIAYVLHQNNYSELVSDIKICPNTKINMDVAFDVQTRITFNGISVVISSKINNLSIYNYKLAPINIQCDCSLQQHSDQRSIIYATGDVNNTPFYLSISCEQNQQKNSQLYDLLFQLDRMSVTGTIHDQNHLFNGSITTNIRDMNIIDNIIPGLSIGTLSNRIDIDDLKVSSVTKLKHIKYKRYCIYDITLCNTITLNLDNTAISWETEHVNINMRSINFDSIHLQNIILNISKNDTHPLHARINGIWLTPFEIELLGKLQTDFKTLNIRISKLTGHINDIHIDQQEEINILLSKNYFNINNVHITFGTIGRLYCHAHLTPLRYFVLLNIQDVNINNPALINNLHIINNFHLDILCFPQEHIYQINQSCTLNDTQIIISSSADINNSIHIAQKAAINNQLNYNFEFIAPYYDGNKLWEELLHQPNLHASLIIDGQLAELQNIVNIPISGNIQGNIKINTDDSGTISSAGFLTCSEACLVYNQEHPITFKTNLKCNGEYINLDDTHISFANTEHFAHLTGIVNLQPTIPYYIIQINMLTTPISHFYHDTQHTVTGHMATKLKLEGDISSSNLSGNINFLDLAVYIYNTQTYSHNNPTHLYTDHIILDLDNINTNAPGNSSVFWTKLPISLNIKITFDTPLELYGDAHTTKWKGAIDIVGYIDNPHFQGQIDLISGTYKLAHRSFSLTKGVCLLQKSSLIDAIWSLEGVTTLNQYTIKAYVENINGRISFALKSYPSLPEDRLLSMIIFGENSSHTQNHYTSTGNIAEHLWHLTMGNSSYSMIKAIYNNIKIYNKDGIKVGIPIHEKCFLGIGECVDSNHPRGVYEDYRHTPRVNVLYSEISIAEQLTILINTGYKYFKLSAKGKIEF